MGNYTSANNTLMFHLVTLTVSWNILANIGVYFALYKYTVKGYYTHILISWLIIIVTLVSTLLYIIPKGIPQACHISQKVDCDRYQFPLAIQGTILTFWLAVQILSGIFSRAWQEYPKATTLGVIRGKRFHQFSGYFIMLLGKINCFIHWRNVIAVWIPLLVWQVICIVLYIKRKWFFTSFEEKVIDQQIFDKNYNIPKIKYIEQLKKNKNQYMVFANYVYDITPLTTLHPAGYQIIDVTKGRQIDRFIYGMYSPQFLPQADKFSHPEDSLRLVDYPIAQIDNQNPYMNMEEVNDCIISHKQLVSLNSQIYIFGFSSINQKDFLYQGYTELSQIGQYFSLTYNSKITRLYTTVNCLAISNRKLINQIINQYLIQNKNQVFRYTIPFFDSQKKKNKQNDELNTNRPLKIRIENDKKNQNQDAIDNFIPLMIKIYEKGKLTPLLEKQEQGQLKISCTRGQGLKLDTLLEGRIVFIAGGTGFFPFMDLVDLIFKRKILDLDNIDNSLKDKILLLNPILESKILKDFQFLFYIALNSAEDLHKISLFQLNYLCGFDNFNCIFRLKQNSQFKKMYTNFKFTNDRFDKIVLPDIQSKNTSKTYICGPPLMAQSLAELLKQNQIDQNRYQFV